MIHIFQLVLFRFQAFQERTHQSWFRPWTDQAFSLPQDDFQLVHLRRPQPQALGIIYEESEIVISTKKARENKRRAF